MQDCYLDVDRLIALDRDHAHRDVLLWYELSISEALALCPAHIRPNFTQLLPRVLQGYLIDVNDHIIDSPQNQLVVRSCVVYSHYSASGN
jgi:hypothetical protein